VRLIAVSRKSKRKPATKRASPPRRPPQFDLFSVVSICALGLYLVRFFVPAESAHLGETLWVVQLWLLLATFTCFVKWRFGDPMTFDRRDVAVWLLVLGHVVGALIVIGTEGQKRAATNMLWEWVGIGVGFSMLKEKIGQPEGLRRLLTGVVIALIVLAGFGLWQHDVWYPQQRELLREFDQLSPESPRRAELAERLGPLADTGDPIAAYVLRQRLTASTEPIGRFALANTLGGLLAAGLVLLSGALVNTLRQEHALRKTACPGVAGFVTGWCLLLTKSRTAWVGLLVGTAVWAVLTFGRRLLHRRTAVMGGSLLAAVIVLAAAITASGGLDRQVVTEAPKALKYRFEYWTGTWGVIRDSWLFGTGPGNFRQHYLEYKLPESSEEILDPHNLFLDVWANGGLIGLCGMLFVLLVGWRAVGAAARNRGPDDPGAAATIDGTLAGGGLVACGLLLAPGVLLGMDWQLVGLAVAAAAAGLLFRWTGVELRFGAAAICGAAITLVVHLLGQGGIAWPVVCLTLLLLLLPAAAANGSPVGMSGFDQRYIGFLATTTAFIGSIACIFTATLPVFVARANLNIGQYEAAQGRLREARFEFQSAAEADPLDPAPWQALAELDFREWQQGFATDESDFQRAMDNLQEAIARDPHHPKRFWTAGQWESLRFDRTRDPEAARLAVQWLARAVEGYPSSSRIRADYAFALAATGQSEAARAEAERALELDQINQQLKHNDKVLDDATRQRLRSLTAEAL
jgi:tetratricopeptide (TPR) repeat protein